MPAELLSDQYCEKLWVVVFFCLFHWTEMVEAEKKNQRNVNIVCSIWNMDLYQHKQSSNCLCAQYVKKSFLMMQQSLPDRLNFERQHIPTRQTVTLFKPLHDKISKALSSMFCNASWQTLMVCVHYATSHCWLLSLESHIQYNWWRTHPTNS